MHARRVTSKVLVSNRARGTRGGFGTFICIALRRDGCSESMPSSVIRYLMYDAASRELRVMLQSGNYYIYRDVSPETAEDMKEAVASGEFFKRHIRGRFRFTYEEPR